MISTFRLISNASLTTRAFKVDLPRTILITKGSSLHRCWSITLVSVALLCCYAAKTSNKNSKLITTNVKQDKLTARWRDRVSILNENRETTLTVIIRYVVRYGGIMYSKYLKEPGTNQNFQQAHSLLLTSDAGICRNWNKSCIQPALVFFL